MRCIQERGGPLHAVRGRPNADFCRIACSTDEGIVLPSYPIDATPTCSDCLTAPHVKRLLTIAARAEGVEEP